MLRTPEELLWRMVFKETPHSFNLYYEVPKGGSLFGANVKFFMHNWGVDGRSIHPRVLRVLEHIKEIECMQDHCAYALQFRTYAEFKFFENVAVNFAAHDKYCPDNPLGLSLLVASFTEDLPYATQILRMLKRASFSAFGCHVLDIDYVDQTGKVVVSPNEPLVHNSNQWGEEMPTVSIRIPLRTSRARCPFYKVALLATVTEPVVNDEFVDFEFIVQPEQGMPWSRLVTTQQAPYRAVDYVLRYGARHTRQTDFRKPFK